MIEHKTTVRKWDRVGTYQASCCCGWVAEWPHTTRAMAQQDGMGHLVQHPTRVTV
jgi:hypothetical protein